ncbi:uncharacterized protein LOC118426928 [Branchiostoma floridae]|uniref:Uncharacterized protein LOC118426928 n=1 Tax=Branchiostoma floridae TaxID=7739 RepID=A0A9J7M0R0_BRAFL|nr:uncharacterized protein LOC118426928 [Branchiostoma floridae]
MAFSGILLCALMMVLAGNSVSGHSPPNGLEDKECVPAVEAMRTYFRKDSVQKFISSTLKNSCLGVRSKDKCDLKVKEAMTDLDEIVFSKMQPKDLCVLRNYTGNGVGKKVQVKGGVLCRTIVTLVRNYLEEHSDLITDVVAEAAAGICSYVPLPDFLFPCKEVVRKFMAELFNQIVNELNPAVICNI